MKTIGGMSVRNEIEARLAVCRDEAWQDGHRQGIEDAIAFLNASDLSVAAATLDNALFEAVARRDAISASGPSS